MKRFGSVWDALVTEAPVTDIGTMGDFNKPGGFKRTADKALIAKSGRLEAIQKAWGKSAHDFRLYFAQFKGGAKWSEHGEASAGDIEQLQQQIGQKLPPADPEKITVIYTNNNGDEWRAATPWILAHRLGHSIMQAGRSDPDVGEAMDELRQVIERHMDELAGLHQLDHRQFTPRTKRTTDPYGSSYVDDTWAKREARGRMRQAVAQSFGAMRSAREGNLRNFFEFVLETLAQYLITGRVYLDDNHRPVVTGHAWGKPQSRTHGKDDAEQIDTIKRDFSLEVPTYIDNVLDRVMGKILVM